MSDQAPKHCKRCGHLLARSARYGYCSVNPECRRLAHRIANVRWYEKHQRAWFDAESVVVR